MKTRLYLLTFLLCAFTPLMGATPAPEKLLGKETLFMITVPNASKACEIMEQWPATLFWYDEAMKPFREKFMTKFSTEVIQPMEEDLGIKLKDYADLAQGQITLAVTPNGWLKDGTQEPSFLLLMDSGEKADTLSARMEELKTKWKEAGNPLRTETIRGKEFSLLTFTTEDLAQSVNEALGEEPAPSEEDAGEENEDEEKPTEVEWMIGQDGSLLILGDSKSEIEKVLTRKAGGSVPSLAENQHFSRDHSKHFRKSMAYVWVNLQTILNKVTAQLSKAEENQTQENELFATPKPNAIMKALGLGALKSVAMTLEEIPQGTLFTTSVNAPENLRKGLFDILKLENKDASPLPFIPQDAIKFSRTRLDIPDAFAKIEKMVGELSPPMAGVMQLVIANAGKEADPNFDLRKNLIANLGDDIITYQKEPKTKTLESLESPPALFFISSPKPEQLSSALKAITSLLPSDGSKVKEREFLGRTVYTINLPPSMSLDEKPINNKLSYTATSGYVALSTDTSLLEEYLRSSNDKPLKETRGLRQAAEKVGGMNKGFFGYENDKVTVGLALEILKKESGNLANLFAGAELAEQFSLGEEEDEFKEWLDFSLLPSFEKVAKYFHFTVYGAGFDNDGFNFRVYSPDPPNLKK